MAVHARSTTFRGRAAAVEAGTAMVRDELLPALERIDGFVGLSMLVAREPGRAIVTTAWDDEPSLKASRQQVAPLRQATMEVIGEVTEVREWEIAVVHRTRPVGEGAWARVTWSRTHPARFDSVIPLLRTLVLPRIDELPGSCSASLLIDRETGLAALATTYESRQALDGTRQAAAALRSYAAQEMPAEVVDVAEFSVEIAHLRVPQTA